MFFSSKCYNFNQPQDSEQVASCWAVAYWVSRPVVLSSSPWVDHPCLASVVRTAEVVKLSQHLTECTPRVSAAGTSTAHTDSYVNMSRMELERLEPSNVNMQRLFKQSDCHHAAAAAIRLIFYCCCWSRTSRDGGYTTQLRLINSLLWLGCPLVANKVVWSGE